MTTAPDHRSATDSRRAESAPSTTHLSTRALWATVFALALAPLPSPRAQVQSTPLTTWTVTIVLPPRLMTGHPATLAVLGVDGKLASDVTVDLGNGQSVKTDRTGRALFTVPATGNYLLAKASGASVAALIDPAVGASEPQGVTLPPVISLGDDFWVCGGGLRGDADANSVKINGQHALVLAASPECLVTLPGPDTKPGPAELKVEPPGVQWSATATLVSLEFEPPSPALQPGNKGDLIVRVRGSNQKLGIVVQNKTPGVVRFLRGDAQEAVTSGGSENFVAVKVQAVTSGDFSFRAHLLPTPQIPEAERYLQAAMLLAPKDMQREIKSLADRLAHHPRDVQIVGLALQQIATQTIVGDLRTLLNAARSSL
jgi:hypothetical protein